MNLSTLFVVSESAMLLFGLWIVLFWLLPAVRLDCFRQRMFAVRDELFDYAASGKISFSHPAYRLLRQSMNGFIRYGHHVTFYQSVMTALTWKALEPKRAFAWQARWQEALASLDSETRADLVRFEGREQGLVAERIILGSPVLIVALVLFLVFALLALFRVGFIALFRLSLKSINDMLSLAISTTAEKLIDKRILQEEAAARAT